MARIHSRNKGASGERELAKVLRDYGFAGARRGQQHSGSPDSPDIADAIPNVHIECKRVERLQLDKAMEQAVRDAGDDLTPTVFHRKNRGEWMVTVRLKDLEYLAANWLTPGPDPEDEDTGPCDLEDDEDAYLRV